MKDAATLHSYDLDQSKFHNESEALAFAVFLQWAQPVPGGLAADIDFESDLGAPGVTVAELMFGFSLLAASGVLDKQPTSLSVDAAVFRLSFKVDGETSRGVFGAAEFATAANALRDRRQLAEWNREGNQGC
jgi:hypothetical protein